MNIKKIIYLLIFVVTAIATVGNVYEGSAIFSAIGGGATIYWLFEFLKKD